MVPLRVYLSSLPPDYLMDLGLIGGLGNVNFVLKWRVPTLPTASLARQFSFGPVLQVTRVIGKQYSHLMRETMVP